MLSPQDRCKAIDLLCKKQTDNILGNGYVNRQLLHSVIRGGFKGYASFTDQQLLNGLQSFVKNSNDHECINFLSSLALEKFVLE